MALGASRGAQSHGHLIGKQSRLCSQHSRSLSYFCSWSICPSWTVQTEGPFLGGVPWEAELALTPYLGRQPPPAVDRKGKTGGHSLCENMTPLPSDPLGSRGPTMRPAQPRATFPSPRVPSLGTAAARGQLALCTVGRLGSAIHP